MFFPGDDEELLELLDELELLEELELELLERPRPLELIEPFREGRR